MKKTDFDVLWKNAIRVYFKHFLYLVLHDLAQDIDWRYKVNFLDQEFHELLGKQKKGERRTDALVKVRLKSGEIQWIYIHIEIQSYHDPFFTERMFQIYYRIRDRYSKNIVALTVFTDSTEMGNRITESLYGTELNFKFNSYYIKEQKREKLLASENPFALAILASLYALKTKGISKARQRIIFKEELFRLFLKSEYSVEQAKTMIVFLDEILKLPKELTLIFNIKIQDMYQEKELQYSPGIEKVLKEHAARVYKMAYNEDLKERNQEIADKLKEEQAKIVVKLFQKGISIDEIVDLVDLSKKEVKAILKSNEII